MIPERIICFGDSITEGQGREKVDPWPARLACLFEEELPGEFDVYNRGVGGNTTAMALDRFQSDVAPLLPGLVLIEFGINDAYVFSWRRTPRVGLTQYKSNLSEIIRLVRGCQGTPVLFVNHPLTSRKDVHSQGNRKSIGQQLIPYNEIVRKLASHQDVACLDFPKLLKKQKVNLKSFHSEDGVHLSPEGNHVYARIVFEQLRKLARNPKSLITCRI